MQVRAILEKLRQRPRRRIKRQISRALDKEITRQNRAILKDLRIRRDQQKAQETAERIAQRHENALARKSGRAELADRKRELRKELRAQRDAIRESRRRVPSLKDYQVTEHLANRHYPAGLHAGLPTNTDGPGPFARAPFSALRKPITESQLCDWAASMNVTIPKEVEDKCADIDRLTTHASPYRSVGWDDPGDWPPHDPDTAPMWARLSGAALQALPRIVYYGDDLEPWEEIRGLVGALAALRIAEHLGIGRALDRLVDSTPFLTIKNGHDPGSLNTQLLTQLGLDPATHYNLAEAGNVPTLPLDRYIGTVGARLTARLTTRQNRWEGTAHDLLRAALYHEIAETAWTIANDGEFPLEYGWPPDWAVLLALAHYNVWPPADTPRAALAAFLARGAEQLRSTGDRQPTLGELRTHAQLAGFTLIPGGVHH